MTIEWKDPNMRLHGKRHKNDRYYFRWHYGKQRRVYMYKEYVDKPTERQVSAREAFTELRREVARQLHDPILRARWEARFKNAPQGYKFIHTYVYAQMKAGITVIGRDEPVARIERRCAASSLQALLVRETQETSVSTRRKRTQRRHTITSLLVVNGAIVPIFLPWKVPKREYWQIE